MIVMSYDGIEQVSSICWACFFWKNFGREVDLFVSSWYYCCCWNILLVIQACFFEWRQCICASSFLIWEATFSWKILLSSQVFCFEIWTKYGKDASRKLLNREGLGEFELEWTQFEVKHFFCFCWLIFFTSFLPRKLTFSQKTDSCKKTWTFSNSLILSF